MLLSFVRYGYEHIAYFILFPLVSLNKKIVLFLFFNIPFTHCLVFSISAALDKGQIKISITTTTESYHSYRILYFSRDCAFGFIIIKSQSQLRVTDNTKSLSQVSL